MFAYPLDQMVGGIFYEHSHRMIASFVGFLTVILALWIWKKDDRRWMKILGFTALGAVIIQGILGGLTVLFLLPTPISVSHATLAQTFFSIVVAIALFTSQWWREPQTLHLEPKKKISTRQLTVFAALGVFIQLILGALMRHTQSGLAVPDFPLAYGQFFPLLSQEDLQRYNEQLISMNIRLAADGPITASQIVIHLLHRFWAVVVTVFVGWSAVRLVKLSDVSSRLKYLGLLLFGLLALQITLGALTVLSQKAIDVTTAHVATGALLLAITVLSVLHVRKLIASPVREHAISYAASTKEVTV